MRRLIRITLITLGSILALLAVLVFVALPIVTRPDTELSPLAAEWQAEGEYISWRSTLPENAEFPPLEIFTIQRGDPSNPAILFIHGYPTSSFDYFELFDELSDDYYVVALDTPGYGLSDKPRDGFVYSIEDDARLVDHYISDILGLESLAFYTHDKGSSVGFALLGLYEEGSTEYELTHHVITNGNVYLPLAELTRGQTMLLDLRRGPRLTRYINGSIIANGIRDEMYATPQPDEVIAAVASSIDYQDGGEVQHATIQYLAQRAEFEETWLDNLRKSRVPATLIWGLDDPVAPTRVADFVWDEILNEREAPAWYWQLEGASHYPQNDRPETISLIVRDALGEETEISDELGPIASRAAQALGDDR